MQFEIHGLYNLTTYAPALFGLNFKRVKVVGIVDYETAKKYANVDLIQRQIFSLLPAGTPDKLSRYSYVLLETTSNTKTVLAYPWIVEDSITAITVSHLNISVVNVDDTDVNKVRDVLNSMGYTFTMEVVDQ